MYTIDVNYKDALNDNQNVSEKMYFNLTVFEFADLAANFNGPQALSEYMTKAFSSEDNYKDGFRALRMLFIAAYGRRQLDEATGRYKFLKKKEWLDELLPSQAFEEVFIKLSTDAKFASAFWLGLVSEQMLAQAQKVYDANPAAGDVKVEAPSAQVEKPVKFRDMTKDQQLEALQKKLAANGVTDVDEL